MKKDAFAKQVLAWHLKQMVLVSLGFSDSQGDLC